MNRYHILAFLLSFISLTSSAQEVISSLQSNPSIIKQANNSLQMRKAGVTNAINLPFVDDFSKLNVYPASDRWADSNVFINSSIAINPKTIGVATFDGIDKHGYLYQNASSSQFIADYLTTLPIRLDSLTNSSPKKITLADSIYLSFFFQPQGISNAPEKDDSLVLEFLSFPPDTFNIDIDTIINDTAQTITRKIIKDHWDRIWAHKGMTYNEFKTLYNKDFQLIMIPITDTKYLRSDFRFRFKNYVSIGNSSQPTWTNDADYWNLDYIYLNITRSKKDTIFDDVAVINNGHTLLKYYESMPWPHFKANAQNEMNTALEITYSNLSAETKNVKRYFSITGEGVLPYNISGGNLNLAPYASAVFTPSASYTYNSSTRDSALFEIKTSVNTTPDINRENDTATYIQKFYNYYSYDDGVPEFGYGLNGDNAQLAYKFNARTKDTLRGVQMFFNQTKDSASQKYFYLTVWKSLEPEEILYQQEGYLPEYTDSLNEFYTYKLNSELLVSGDFYVGWKQVSNENLNLGFDANSTFGWDESKQNNAFVFYNTQGSWLNSIRKGALMIRPVFGKKLPVGIESRDDQASKSINIYPNPASEIINISNNSNEQIEYSIADLTGRIVSKGKATNTIDIKDITEGIYLISVLKDKQYHTQRLIIAR